VKKSTAIIIVAVGCVIAAIAPFDTGLAFLAKDSVLARICLFAAIACVGVFCSYRSGLQLKPAGLRFPVLTPRIIALSVALYVGTIDCIVFRAIIPDIYLNLFRSVPLGTGLLSFMMRAWNENIIYRLTMMSALAWVVSFLWKNGDRPATGAFVLASVLAQVINISINVAKPSSPTMLAYDLVRYIVPGVLWGYLYWRLGFTTAEITSVATPPFLQPLLGVALT
jgi:hypothetical protein